MKLLLKLIGILCISTLSIFANEKISLQLLWKHQFEFAGFYMAKEKGFYKKVGVEVDIKEFDFGMNIVDDVLSGAIDIGIGRSTLILDRLNGKDVVLLSAIYQSSPFVLVSKQRPDLLDLEDFKNKKIMLSDDFALIASVSSMMKMKDIKPTDYTEVPHSFNIKDLVDGKVDLMTTYLSNEPFHLIESGVGYRVFNPKDYGFDFYADIVFTSQKYLDANKENIDKFHEATLKGWEYAFDNIDETVNVIMNKYNSQNKSEKALYYEAGVLKKLAYVDGVKFGSISEARIQKITYIYRLLGITNKSDATLDGLVYEPHKFSDILKQIFSLNILLLVVGLLILSYLLVLYKQNILKKENKKLEEIVERKTQKLKIYNKELEKQKDLYDLVFEKSATGVLLIDIQSKKIIECNTQVVNLLGAESKEYVIGKFPSELSCEFQHDGKKSDEKAEEYIRHAVKSGKVYFEWIHKKVDGEQFWVEVSLTKLNIDAKDFLYVTWKDINGKKQAEQELQKSRTTLQLLNESLEEKIKERTRELEYALNVKSNFLANMSHEIRTPLNGIVGFVDILYKKETDEKKQAKLQIIKESSHSLLTIINDILDFSKIESKKLLIEKIPVNLKEIFEHIIELFFDKAKEKNVKITLNLDDNLPKSILGDATRVKQVISNILSNAIKFANIDSTIVINVNYLINDHKLYCEIIDKGIGINSSKIDSIFNSFEQADSSVSRSYGGTGLGLSISKTLVELMGGTIGVESEIGKGSKFYFTIDIDEVKSEVKKEVESFEEHKELIGEVLIVEDNVTNQMLLKLLLKELELEADLANDGLEAVEAVRKKEYNIILMDENMPNMSGLEATRVIRELEFGKKVPIIAVTANALKGDRKNFTDNGMNDYLSKPIDFDKLKYILQKYL